MKKLSTCIKTILLIGIPVLVVLFLLPGTAHAADAIGKNL